MLLSIVVALAASCGAAAAMETGAVEASAAEFYERLVQELGPSDTLGQYSKDAVRRVCESGGFLRGVQTDRARFAGRSDASPVGIDAAFLAGDAPDPRDVAGCWHGCVAGTGWPEDAARSFGSIFAGGNEAWGGKCLTLADEEGGESLAVRNVIRPSGFVQHMWTRVLTGGRDHLLWYPGTAAVGNATEDERPTLVIDYGGGIPHDFSAYDDELRAPVDDTPPGILVGRMFVKPGLATVAPGAIVPVLRTTLVASFVLFRASDM